METTDRPAPDASNSDIVRADLHQEVLLNGPKLWDGSDRTIADNAREALSHHHLAERRPLDASAIDVSVEAGIVRLSGRVPDGESKRAAVRCVHDLPGVKGVKNELSVARTWWDRARSVFNHSAE